VGNSKAFSAQPWLRRDVRRRDAGIRHAASLAAVAQQAAHAVVCARRGVGCGRLRLHCSATMGSSHRVGNFDRWLAMGRQRAQQTTHPLVGGSGQCAHIGQILSIFRDATRPALGLSGRSHRDRELGMS
jgi:hypothetical protein